MKRVFSTDQYGPVNTMRNSLDLVSVKEKRKKELWIKSILQFLIMSAWKDSKPTDFAIIQFMECSKALDKADKGLFCMYVNPSAEDKIDHTVGTWAYSKNRNCFMVKNGFEWNCLIVSRAE